MSDDGVQQMGKPTIGVGHFKLRVSDIDRSVDFYVSLGMIETHPRMKNMAILDLRGGTHFLLFRAKTKPRATTLPFDLAVSDVKKLQLDLRERGFTVGPTVNDTWSYHKTFTCRDPDGHLLTFTSEHADEES
jgi:catechol 2,3-dioxygenase-like lactoylglutathione lyase family enzyme